MLKKRMPIMSLCILALILVALVVSINQVAAQETRSIVPRPRGVEIETIDPMTKMPKRSFCIGVNTIDVRLTNDSGYALSVSVVNRDTSGREQRLYSGQLSPGVSYLSVLLGAQLELTGPAGTETVGVVPAASGYGQSFQNRWVSFYVQNCGSPGPWPPSPGPWPGNYALWAQAYPYAIEQGKKGSVLLQTSVGAQPNMTYYFEILNSWNQLWKRIPVSKGPYERYQVILPVGSATKPGRLTYTVNLWMESGFGGQRQKVASTQFSFEVVTPGSMPPPYSPHYQGYPGYPGMSPYGSAPYYGTPPMPSYSGTSPYGMSPYGSSYPRGSGNERQIQ